MTANPDIAESLSAVEFDVESESFRAAYDRTRDSTSLAVVAVVVTALGGNSLNLTPLHSVIDTDSLDGLATKSSNGHGHCDNISFCHEGFEITAFSDSIIEGNPTENA